MKAHKGASPKGVAAVMTGSKLGMGIGKMGGKAKKIQAMMKLNKMGK